MGVSHACVRQCVEKKKKEARPAVVNYVVNRVNVCYFRETRLQKGWFVTGSRPLQHENTLSVRHTLTYTQTYSHLYIHLHANTHRLSLTHTHAHGKCLHIFSLLLFLLLPPLRLPTVTDMPSHSGQLKLRHHGYSCRDVLCPGDRQYWTTPLTTQPIMHSFSCLLCLCHVKGNYGSWPGYRNPGRCMYPASSSPWVCPGLAAVFFLERPWDAAESLVG